MGQPSQANTKKLLGTAPPLVWFCAVRSVLNQTCVCWPGTRKSFDHLISDSKAPKRPEMESGMTTPPKMRRVAENDYEIGERKLKVFLMFGGLS